MKIAKKKLSIHLFMRQSLNSYMSVHPYQLRECNRLNLSSICLPLSIMKCTLLYLTVVWSYHNVEQSPCSKDNKRIGADILTSKKLIGGGGEQSPGGGHGGCIHITSFGSQKGHPSQNVPSGFVCKKKFS